MRWFVLEYSTFLWNRSNIFFPNVQKNRRETGRLSSYRIIMKFWGFIQVALGFATPYADHYKQTSLNLAENTVGNLTTSAAEHR